MFVRNLDECVTITANDGCTLRELFNPHKDAIPVGYSLAEAVVRPGECTLRHHLVGASEVYYLISGSGVMHIDDEVREVRAGDALVIPPDAVQFLENTGSEDIVFLAIVEPAWKMEIDVRDEQPEGTGPSGRRGSQKRKVAARRGRPSTG